MTSDKGIVLTSEEVAKAKETITRIEEGEFCLFAGALEPTAARKPCSPRVW